LSCASGLNIAYQDVFDWDWRISGRRMVSRYSSSTGPLGDCLMRALFWLVLFSGGALWFDGAYCSGQHTQDAIQMFNDVISMVG
jgi:hypothetical protein